MLDSLNSLPQTIEETYELILLEIDEQDWSFARTIFLWVCGNDMLPGSAPIPVDTLLSVLEKNGLDPTVSVSENCKELIEEICSCMLTINVTTLLSGGTEEDVDTAKCAHYTVVEYLFSEQIKASKVAFFALSDGEIVAEFVATTIAVAETVDLQNLPSEYWESFQSYCSRAAWLSPFTWESDLAEHVQLWMSLIHIWSNSSSYFSFADDLFRHDSVGRMPQSNYSCYLTLKPEDEAQRAQEFPPGILACLLLNSSHILANKLVSHYGTDILEMPFHFDTGSAIGGSKIPPKRIHFGSAVEAASLATVSFSDLDEVLGVVEHLSRYFDNTQLALISVGLHVRPKDYCECGSLDNCSPITMLLQYVEADSDIQYCLTPLQLSVYCLDLRAVEALLDFGVNPNAVGARDGRHTPIYLFKVDDRWWSASPLHMIRHAGFAAEEIDGTINVMESREAQRIQIEEMLIQSGAEDFGFPSDTSASIQGSTRLGNSSLDVQLLSDQDELDAFDFDEFLNFPDTE